VTSLGIVAAAAALTMGSAAAQPDADLRAAFAVQPLHLAVHVGPDHNETCDIDGDLYVPEGVDSAHRAPAILTTNGFAGSKTSVMPAGFARYFAGHGYVVLDYSGLGNGKSGCKATLDDPQWDGEAGSQLISYLGGADGIAFADAAHTEPLPALDIVTLDSRAHDGTEQVNDPRVGMIAGSYGGEVQFAIASVDPRLDTIVPIYTWNDLSYSLAPNNTDQVNGVSTALSGMLKLSWSAGFTVRGMLDPALNGSTDLSRLIPCPNFATFVCPAVVQSALFGYFRQTDVDALRRVSVVSYLDKVRIPTLLMQGQKDTMFNLNEAVATYDALRSQGTPVTMIWQSWGHSDEQPQPGELDLSSIDPTTQYQAARITDWFAHYLRDEPVGTGPGFAYFRDWVPYSGNAEPAYGVSSSFPIGSPTTFRLAGSTLATTSTASGQAQNLLTTAAGLPTNLDSFEEPSLFGKVPVPELDLPGTTAAWQSLPLTDAMDVVGSPTLTLRVNSLTAALTQGAGPAGKLVLFVRIRDVGPDGTAQDVHQLTAPVRVPDVRQPFTVTLPGIVHRFAVGHRVQLVIAGSSLNYRGGVLPQIVSVPSGADQRLELPVVP
jgi:ABC-2 type transport system ATP-binding protein